MDRFQQLDSSKKSLCRVELHAHLDGSIRHETVWEILKKKGMKLPGDGSLQDLKDAVIVKIPKDLAYFLRGFDLFMPAFVGDLEAIERIAYEFVEDKHRDRVLYVEARFAPHLLLSKDHPEVKPRDILKAVIRGFRRGEADFKGTKARIILCCMRGLSQWDEEIVDMCEEFRPEGVVALDIAGDEAACVDKNGNPVLHPNEVAAFHRAKKLGIHRTCHAGEAGPASMVKVSIENLYAERIGHGYHSIDDEDVYKFCQERNIHFEACPYSSLTTGAVALNVQHHPILRFCEDRVSFSINTDDFCITGSNLDEEYELLSKWGMREADFAFCNFKAAEHAFLPKEEKEELISKLKKAYGVP